MYAYFIKMTLQSIVSAIARAGWSADSSCKLLQTSMLTSYNISYFGFPDQSGQNNIIDGNINTVWTSNKRREFVQVDMKTSHYVHRVHIKLGGRW